MYPGCTTIDGNVKIYFNNDFQRIDSLHHIDSIHGHVEFGGTYFAFLETDSLHAFPNLKEISGNLILSSLNYLERLSGFDSVRHIGGQLEFRNLWNLKKLDVLESLETIGEDLVIYYSTIPDNSFLPRLRSVERDLYIEARNDTLLGFDSLRVVGGSLILWELYDLSALSPFPSLEHIGERFTFVRSLNASFYSGFSKLKTVSGDLSIAETYIDSLSGFGVLDSIGGSLLISGHDTLRDFSGFPRVRHIGKSVMFKDNSLLETFVFGQDLDTIPVHVEISNNGSLETISGFHNLTKIGGRLRIESNPKLSQIDFFSMLISCNDLHISENNILTSLTNLQQLKFIGNDANIYANPRLQDLHSLVSLKSIGGDFSITQNDSLRSMSFESLDTIYGTFRILNNPLLTDFMFTDHLFIKTGFTLDGNNSMVEFPHLDQLSTTTYEIKNNQKLTSLSASHSIRDYSYLTIDNNDQLVSIDLPVIRLKNLRISNNDVLPNLEGLDGLKYVERLYIEDNLSLTHLNGLTMLDTIRFLLHITRNDSLINLAGLSSESLKRLSSVTIENNPSLENLAGPGSVEWIQNLTIKNNAGLKSLSGLTSLDKVGSLRILENPGLTSLNGLESIAFIRNQLQINKNPLLTDLRGIQDAFIESHHYSSIEIKHNTSLSACAVESICTYFLNSDHQVIDSNAIGCNSVPEVEAQCLLISTEEIFESFDVYPNPVSNELFSSTQLQEGAFKLYNQTGKQVLHGHWNGYLQVSHLPQGIYTLLLESDDTTYTSRFLKY